ncbi:MAG TPA: nitrogen regulation protein NR(I) [Steroidobacteraceae bacterium]|jgi:two-component system nitrogen regulation response regulator GlnG|nr:nitrogen regulation protein NR(I) [Steroidobacteraceae bacterium]
MRNQPVRVWLADDDCSIRWVLERALKIDGMTPTTFNGAEGALAALRTQVPDVLMADVRMPGEPGWDLLRRIHDTRPQLPVIVMTAYSDITSAVSAYECGAFEYLPKPFDIHHAVDLVKRAATTHVLGTVPAQAAPGMSGFLGRAPAMQQVFRAIGRLSRTSMTVLITGESGTGKELAARALHEHSPRAGRPFVAINTSAIPSGLMEAELFGHEKGAFTGADSLRRGRFEQADGGCLFLDEIGDMSLPMQTRLLRVLADGEFYRVGGQIPVKVDVRVIAATHQPLEDQVRSGKFREDLFHRLNVMRMDLPPLRARREDIPELMDHYMRVAAQELGTASKRLDAQTRILLADYSWPGNVRELANLCRRLTALAPASEVTAQDLPPDLRLALELSPGKHPWVSALELWGQQQAHDGAARLMDQAVPLLEKALIGIAMQRTLGKKLGAAKLLGWGRNTLTRKMQELDIYDEYEAG